MSISTTWFGGVGLAGVGAQLSPIIWPCWMGPMKFPFGWTCFFEGLINVRKLWNSQGNEFEMYPYYVPNPKKKKHKNHRPNFHLLVGSRSMQVFFRECMYTCTPKFSPLFVTFFFFRWSATIFLRIFHRPRAGWTGATRQDHWWLRSEVFLMACTYRSLRMSSCFALSVMYFCMSVGPWAKKNDLYKTHLRKPTSPNVDTPQAS